MKRYFISHQDDLHKKLNNMLYDNIKEQGEFIYSKWGGDYLIAVYLFDNKIYELWDNMEYGIRSEIDEYEIAEYIKNITKRDDK